MIENDIVASAIDTILDLESTGVDVRIILVYVESTKVRIDKPGVQDTSHEENNNEDEDDHTRKKSDEDIPEEDVHYPQLT